MSPRLGFILAVLLPQPATTDEGCKGMVVASGEGYKRVVCLSIVRTELSAALGVHPFDTRGLWDCRAAARRPPNPLQDALAEGSYRAQAPPREPPVCSASTRGHRSGVPTGSPPPSCGEPRRPRVLGVGARAPACGKTWRGRKAWSRDSPRARRAFPRRRHLVVSRFPRRPGPEHSSLANSERLADESAGDEGGCSRLCPKTTEPRCRGAAQETSGPRMHRSAGSEVGELS